MTACVKVQTAMRCSSVRMANALTMTSRVTTQIIVLTTLMKEKDHAVSISFKLLGTAHEIQLIGWLAV